MLTEVATDLMAAFPTTARGVPRAPARDLTLGQIRLLFMLLRDGPQPMGQIAEGFGLSSTASSGFVGRIERHGLVERRHRSDDRRVVECSLTDAGSHFLQLLTGVRIDLIRRRLSRLEPEELAELDRLLRLIRERGHERVGDPA